MPKEGDSSKMCLLCARFYFVYLRNAQKARDKGSSNVFMIPATTK